MRIGAPQRTMRSQFQRPYTEDSASPPLYSDESFAMDFKLRHLGQQIFMRRGRKHAKPVQTAPS